MFNTSCEIARFLENLTEEVLELENGSIKKWKVRETSITDTIIATFRAHKHKITVDVDASEETKTGADFEVVFSKSGKDVAILFQAKRVSKTKGGRYNIPEIFHPHGSGNQNQDLLNYCNSFNVAPYYAIYLSDSAERFAKTLCKPATGIMCQHALTVRTQGFQTKGNSKRNDLMLSNHIPGAIPFHKFFCMFESCHQLEDFVEIFTNSKEPRGLITDAIPLKQRRERDENDLVSTRLRFEL